MYLPADLVLLRTSITTNVTPNTVTSHTLLAAPGAGKRYRLWYWSAHGSQTGAAADAERILPTDNGTSIDGAVFTRNSGSGPYVYPGGYALAVNTAIVFQSFGSAASMGGSITVGYTLEKA
jgi:hypothetical protein